MTTGLTVLYQGPEQIEHHRFGFEDDRDPEFSEDTIYYEESTKHWVMNMDELPKHKVPDWPEPGKPTTTPVAVRIPREQVLLVNQWKPYNQHTPNHDTPGDAISAEIVYDTPDGEESSDRIPTVLNNQTVEFLDEPAFDSTTGHWECRFNEFDARDSEGETNEVTQFIPRERVLYVYS